MKLFSKDEHYASTNCEAKRRYPPPTSRNDESYFVAKSGWDEPSIAVSPFARAYLAHSSECYHATTRFGTLEKRNIYHSSSPRYPHPISLQGHIPVSVPTTPSLALDRHLIFRKPIAHHLQSSHLILELWPLQQLIQSVRYENPW